MRCPKCIGESLVTRTVTTETTVERERECRVCSWRWTTMEFQAVDYRRMRQVLELAAKLQGLAAEG